MIYTIQSIFISIFSNKYFLFQAVEFSKENALAVALACKDEVGATDGRYTYTEFYSGILPIKHMLFVCY